MADESSKTPPEDEIDVECPLCRGHLSVHRDTGEVLAAKPPADRIADFDRALGEVVEGSDKRERDFRKAFKVEEQRGDLLEKKFKKAKEEADDGKPRKNPLDF